MKRFLIDVNLPYKFSFWNTEEFIHQHDLGEDWDDTRIWNYAKENNLTILTKDTDFTYRIEFHTPPPKVIQICIGNLRKREMYTFFEKNWNNIVSLNDEYKLVKVYQDRLEGIH